MQALFDVHLHIWHEIFYFILQLGDLTEEHKKLTTIVTQSQ